MAFRTYHWQVPTMMVVCSVVILLFVAEYAVARPTWTMPSTLGDMQQFPRVPLCDQNETLMELCQRCAKVTKSNLAYPMCCNDSEGAIQWCNDYVYFGIP